jgi:two-component system response regulator AtoC
MVPNAGSGALAAPASHDEDGMTRFSALVVDDDKVFRESLAVLVDREGFDVRTASTLAETRLRLAESWPDVILVDLQLPDGRGVELLHDEEIAIRSEMVVITGNATVESAVEAMRDGALSYLTKPLDPSRLKSVLASASRTRAFKAEVGSLREELRRLGRFGHLVGRSPAMQQVYDLIARVAPTQASVLLSGESGTGKEVAAHTIHILSRRHQGPFLAVNCGAVVKSLIESELFGHERGSFTGAEASRQGYFERAHGGTLFLDEVSEMAPELQVKLLRVLETGTIVRVGASDPIAVDVRVIGATNRDPQRAVSTGILREDLFYRLNVFPIFMPPLRDRDDDIELLAHWFLDLVNARDGTHKRWSPNALNVLRSRPWPGNVRELKNSVERAAIMADEAIGSELFPDTGARAPVTAAGGEGVVSIPIGSTLEAGERMLILATMARFAGDKKRTAEALGISLKTLYSRLAVYQAGRPGTTDPGVHSH